MADASKPVRISNVVKTTPENPWIRAINLVREFQPVNLGQGFPDFPEVVPQSLKSALAATQSIDSPASNNQYARAQGQLDFVQELALLYGPLHGRTIDHTKEVITTVGAYEALHCAINAVTNPGDEVILIEPYFDSYGETVRALGGTTRCVPLRLKPGGMTSNDFEFDRTELENAFNEKTRCVVVNTPHNPTGKVFTKEEIEFIADLCKKHNCLYLSDEVYEWLIYEGYEHFRAATLPGMWERTITVGSGGKTFNATGFRSGWAIGPDYLIAACMNVHQGVVFTAPTPIQIALAETVKQERQLLGTEHSYWHWLKKTLSHKRDRMFKMASQAGLNPIMPCGGYFMLTDISKLEVDPPSDNSELRRDQKFVEWMIMEKGLASIPVSVFFSNASRKEFCNFVRFCFIKDEKTLDAAEEKLRNLKLK